MNFSDIKYPRIFEIFEQITTIPHGSQNCSEISKFCTKFAVDLGLKYYSDASGNVVIYKNGTFGLENAEPIILQGHLDMVCQKTADSSTNFLTDPLKLIREGDMLSAEDTTLGADNGIAVAMVLAILESSDIKHPPIEAVFTVDEEIGMLGAIDLDMSVLSANRMVNLDAEEDNSVIVSCAGGTDVFVSMPLNRIIKTGYRVTAEITGLQGGHSGVEINSGRVNSNLVCGRLLNSIKNAFDFDIISINGGDKGNAITNYSKIELLTNNVDELCEFIISEAELIKKEVFATEKDFSVIISSDNTKKEYEVFSAQAKEDAVYTLACIPDGVQAMSFEIENLVETSLNLGIVKTTDDEIVFLSTLRSNKESTLISLQNKLKTFYSKTNGKVKSSGFYPPWEYKSDSELSNKFVNSYINIVGEKPYVNAIHAGLECAVFASKIKNIDCIAIGPNIYDVHTVNEKLSISSTLQTFEILLDLLSDL